MSSFKRNVAAFIGRGDRIWPDQDKGMFKYLELLSSIDQDIDSLKRAIKTDGKRMSKDQYSFETVYLKFKLLREKISQVEAMRLKDMVPITEEMTEEERKYQDILRAQDPLGLMQTYRGLYKSADFPYHIPEDWESSNSIEDVLGTKRVNNYPIRPEGMVIKINDMCTEELANWAKAINETQSHDLNAEYDRFVQLTKFMGPTSLFYLYKHLSNRGLMNNDIAVYFVTLLTKRLEGNRDSKTVLGMGLTPYQLFQQYFKDNIDDPEKIAEFNENCREMIRLSNNNEKNQGNLLQQIRAGKTRRSEKSFIGE